MSSGPRLRFLLASVCIILLAFWLRLASLFSLPVFVDEANHLLWAQRLSLGNTVYPLFMDGKFLMGALVALFQPLGPGPLWISRGAVALLSIPSVAACLALGAWLGSRRAGLLAGLFYALLPQAVFHERQLLADPLMSAFGSLAIVFSWQLAKSGRWRYALPLALSLAAAFSAKLFGGLYIIFPLLAGFILPAAGQTPAEGPGLLQNPAGQFKLHQRTTRSRPASASPRRRTLGTLLQRLQSPSDFATALLWGQQIASILLAAVFVGASMLALYPWLGENDQKLASQQIGFVSCPPLLCRGDLAGQLDNLQHAFRTLGELIPPYLGWPLIALALTVWLFSKQQRRRSIVWLAAGALAMLAAFLAIARDIPPRYVAFIAAPTVILAAQWVTVIRSRLSIALVVYLSLLASAQTALIIVNPLKAALPNLDQQQYVTQGSSAVGIDAAALALGDAARRNPPPVVLVDNIPINFVAAYFDRTRVDVRGLGDAYPADLGRWLLEGQAVYLFDELPAASTPPGFITQTVGQYPRSPETTIRVQQIIGVKDSIREKIYAEFFIRPEKLADHFSALASNLPLNEPAILLVYPPNQSAAIAPWVAATRPNINVIPIGDSWPLDRAAVEDELDHLTAGQPQVSLVFVEETKGDPERRIETWLNTHLFRLDEQWFGPVRIIGFAGDGSVAQTIPVGARFGDGVTLESVEALDQVVSPGGVLRLRLNWRAGSPVNQTLKIFVHLFAGDTLRAIAQHDGQPVGELRPTHTWQTGEPIADQFAIRLPGNAPPGLYQLRIGMYDISSQARLPMLLPDGETGEFFIGGSIEVK